MTLNKLRHVGFYLYFFDYNLGTTALPAVEPTLLPIRLPIFPPTTPPTVPPTTLPAAPAAAPAAFTGNLATEIALLATCCVVHACIFNKKNVESKKAGCLIRFPAI